MKYFQAVKIRNNAISAGKELKTNFLMGKRERANYSSPDHMQRLEIIEDAAWEIEWILIECADVRIADSCLQTLLKIQTPTNAIQKLRDGK